MVSIEACKIKISQIKAAELCIDEKLSYDEINEELSFNINNHIEMQDPDTSAILDMLEEKWEQSLELAHQIQDGIMTSQLEAAK